MTIIQPNRRDINRQRRALSEQQRRLASQRASRHLTKLRPRLPTGANVAIYLDDFGELPTQPIVDWCRRLRFKVYLPVVHTLGQQDKRLRFAPFSQSHLCQVPSVRHALGMQQPNQRRLLWAQQLHVMFCPLVAADLQGNRMGMGGGYYDTTLAPAYKSQRKQPLRIGWCYEFQVVERLSTQPWDVPLHALITPDHIRWF